MKEEFVVSKSKTLGLSVEGTRRVLDSAFKESAKLFPMLQTALDQGNHADIQSVSHRLKGIFANLQMMDVSASAQSINLAAINKEDLGRIKELHQQFVNQFEILKKESSL